MPSAPYDLSISAARADALFASPLQHRGALVPVFLRELVGPQADHPPDGLGGLSGG
jgi:hypothetical protein